MKIQSLRCILTVCVAFSILFVCPAIAQEQAKVATPPKPVAVDSGLNELMTTVYCPCGCVRETIKACVCATAQQIEADFRTALTAGGTVQEIRTAYLERHGPQFSAVMPAKGVNLLAYLMPVGILIAMGAVAFVVLRRARNRNWETRTQPDTQISNELQQRVESELAKHKEQS